MIAESSLFSANRAADWLDSPLKSLEVSPSKRTTMLVASAKQREEPQRGVARVISSDSFGFNSRADLGWCDEDEEDAVAEDPFSPPVAGVQPRICKVTASDMDWFDNGTDRKRLGKKKTTEAAFPESDGTTWDSFGGSSEKFQSAFEDKSDDKSRGSSHSSKAAKPTLRRPSIGEKVAELDHSLRGRKSADTDKDNSRRGRGSTTTTTSVPTASDDMDLSRRSRRSTMAVSTNSATDPDLDRSRRGRLSTVAVTSAVPGERKLHHSEHHHSKSSSDKSSEDMGGSRSRRRSTMAVTTTSTPDAEEDMDRSRRGRPNTAEADADRNRRGRRSTMAHPPTTESPPEDSDMDMSRRGRRHSVGRRSRRATMATTTKSEAADADAKANGSDMDRSRPGRSRRSTMATGTAAEGEEHRRYRSTSRRRNPRGSSVSRGDGDEGESARSRSRSRRASTRTRRAEAKSRSMLGGGHDSESSDDEDIEAIFKKAKEEERRSMLDKSRIGPVRALARQRDNSSRHLVEDAEREEERNKQKQANKKTSSLDDLLRMDVAAKLDRLSCAASVQPDAKDGAQHHLSSAASLPGDPLPSRRKDKEHKVLRATASNWTYAVDEILETRRHGRDNGSHGSPRSHKAHLDAFGLAPLSSKKSTMPTVMRKSTGNQSDPISPLKKSKGKAKARSITTMDIV